MFPVRVTRIDDIPLLVDGVTIPGEDLSPHDGTALATPEEVA